MKKKGMLICCCDKASKNCYLTCTKGRRLDPERVFIVPQWKRK